MRRISETASDPSMPGISRSITRTSGWVPHGGLNGLGPTMAVREHEVDDEYRRELAGDRWATRDPQRVARSAGPTPSPMI